MIGLPSAAQAQQARYWDPNGTAANRGGTGTWDTSLPSWSPNGDGVSGPYSAWTNAGIDDAIFGGPNGTNATVTLGTPIVAHNLTFDLSTTYTLSGSTLTLAGTTPTITTNGTATINSILAGTAGLTKAGAGVLTLTGANIFSGGVNVTAGTLSVSGDSSLGAASNTINLSAGAILRSTGALASSRVVTLLSGSSAIGGGVGSAHITGTGGFSLAAQTTLSDDTNDFTGGVATDSSNLYFTSIRNLGEASALGAATTAANGTVAVRNASAVYLGSGDTSNRGWNMAPSTGSSALRNQGTGTLTVTGDIIAGGGFTASVILDAQTADLALLGIISSNLATRPFVFTGGGTNRSITLNGANTFGGAVTIQTVTVKANTLANQGTASSLGTGAGVGTISLNSGALSYIGTGSSTNRALFLNGASSIFNDGTGALNLNGAAAFNPANPGDTLTLGGSFAGNNTLSGVISGNGNLAINGAAGSTWLLSGTNTYVGSTTVTSGALRAGSSQALGAPNALIVNGGTLDLNNNAIEVTSLAGTGGSVALTGADLTVNGTTSTTYAGSITGTGGLIKRSTSTLTLTGQNSYTGDTTINGGTLALNFAAAGAPITNIISNSSALNMAGGTLTLTGAAGVANSQTLDGLNVTAGNNRIVTTSGAGGSMTLNLGALTRTGGLMDFTLPISGAITTTNGDGALGWATVNGTDYAQILAGTITAFTAYSNKDDAGTWLTGDIVSDTGGAANTPFANTVVGNVQLGGIKYTAAANSTVTVGGGNTLGVDGTIIVAASIGNASQTITGGSLTGGSGGGTIGVLHNGTGTGTFTIASTIVNNGGATGFIKGGAGRVSLTGANSYTGGTTLSGGTLVVNSVANGGVASSIGASTAAPSNLVIESGTLEYAGATAATDRGFVLVNGGSSRTIQITNGAANLTFSGVVSGPDDASLIKTGTGTLTLANAANTFTGVTTVSGGTLAVGTLANGGVASGIGAATADSANLVLQNAGGLQYSGGTASSDRGFTLGTGNGRIGVSNPAATLTLGGPAIGSGGLVKEGGGTLVLSGTNLYQGGTTISAGTLRAGSVQAFGSSTALMTVNAGATLDLAGLANTVGALSGGGTILLGSATLTSGGVNGTFTGTISGSGGFTRAGGGTQTILGCTNTYTGATSLVGGALNVDCLANGGLASGIGASTSASANLVLNNSILTYTGGSTSIDRGFTASVTGAVNVANAATVLEFKGAVAGSGVVRKDGAGTLILSGNNTYTGATSVTGGILRAGSINGIGKGGLGLNDTAGVVVDFNNFNAAISYLNGGGPTGGNITLGTATLTIGSNAGGGSYGGAISGTGGLIKGGTITQALVGCGSSYTGSTEIRGGVLQVGCLTDGGANSAIGASSNAAGNLILNGGTLSYIGAAGSTNRLFTLGASAANRLDASGTGAIAFTGTGPIGFTTPNTSQTLALGGTNIGNNSLAAQITNNGAGVTALTKDGVGTWILNNPNSTYTGVTTINGGVLGVDKLSNGGVASSIGASLAAASNLIIGNGSTLRYTGTGDTTNRLFTLSAGVTFIESSGTGAIVFTDTGLVTLAGTNQARTIALGGTNNGNNTLAGSIGNAGTGITTLAKNDGGTWLLTGTNTYTGPTNINAGTLILGNGGMTGSIASATVNDLGILGFNRSDTMTFGGIISQAGSVQQLGTGITVLTGANTYTGGTTISAGRLQLGNGGTTGSITGNVTDNGVLAFNRSDIVAFNGVISGTGSVRQDGAGTTILTGTNSYAGGTAINAGTLQVSSDANLGGAAGPISFNNGILRTTANISSARAATLTGAGTMLTDAGTGLTLSGVVSGAGGLTKSGTGTLILTGANGYTGDTTISGGTLSLGNGGTSGSIIGNVANNGAVVFNRSDTIGFGGLVSGTGSVTQTGAGIVTLTGSNSYTGVTNVNTGTLLINGNQSAATGLTSIASGAKLGGGGIIGGNVNVASGGILAPGNSPGTMTINGNLSLASGSILNFEFGQADVAGGPLNDLVNVGGNLVLDGTINVSVSAGGAFGGGIYRVFNYGGALIDNGLTLGLMPGGSSVTVQTSVAGQVNLINSVGLSLSFWDGNAGPKFNNVIDGGNGTWHLGGADNNWTNADGSVNAAYADGTLAIFAGTAGTVTVDNTGGAVTASGLQFASNGYLLNGAPLTLVGPDSMIRVGDGTAAGAGYTATIAAVITGATRLVKTDVGTLVLTGANSYSGGTAINGGTLSVATDASLGGAGGALSFDGGVLRWTGGNFTNTRTINWGASGGGFDISSGAAIYRVNQALTSGGALTKLGAGTLVLASDNGYTGGTTIAAGTLQVGAGGTTGSILGDVVNNGTLTFNRSDASTFAGAITGTGAVSQIAAGTITLTGNSNYSGATNISGGGGIRVAGGTVSSSGGAFVNGGTLSVDGPASVFNLGAITAQSASGVAGVVNVQNGGVLRTSGTVALRNTPLNIALTTLNVSGWGSLADIAGAVTVGISGASNVAGVNVSAGGKLKTGAASQVGAAAGNTTAPFVTITGAGSDWTSTSSLAITNGALSLLNGGTASFTTVTAGTVSAARPASVLVSGTGSHLATSGNLVIGSGAGTGALTLADGGRVNVGGAFVLADAATATGILNIGGAEGQAAAATGLFDAATLNLGSATSRINFNHTDPAYTFASAMSGTGNVNQVAGTTILTGNNSYTGATNVSGGTLIVNGDQTAATGSTTIASGATIGGRGTIGGTVVVNGGTINPGDIGIAPSALTINGNLNIATGSTLNVNLGQANVVGGAFNDLINVGGNLVLDGTLNVQTSVGGSFDTGIYRLINYAGTLTDNGLSTIPSPNLYVQTSIANQVNLVNTSGLQFRFWDGTGPKNDGVVNGGDGVWQNFTGNDNWVDDGSTPNAPFADNAFAVFMGAAGTVTVDANPGAVNATGMQFLTDGYVIQGDALTLTGAQATIRVGDGTAAGAATTATIAADLTGAAQLLKSDLGTLILSGSNSYTGGTAINAGVLQISADANLGDAAGGLIFNGGTLRTTADFDSARTIDLAGNGTLLTDGGTTSNLTGAIGGAGNLTKNGAGTLILTGANSYSGSTAVNSSALFINGNQNAATGSTSVASGAVLGGRGVIGGNVSIADGGTLDPGGVDGLPGTLTINGNLSLAGNSTLSMQFGEANVAGGTRNDLVNVGGNLTLDGTLNVSVSAGGSFGPGIYRVFNYGGTLTDNDLTLGTMPGGSTVSLQTAVVGQVNLVNTAGQTLTFWDGAAGPKNNGQIDGGNGVWRIGGGSNNWTDSSGALNADYTQGSFAIFSAAPGTVSVENGSGNVFVSGMQFASDGYVITGDALTLSGGQTLVQVGDGSAAGAGYTATIENELAGSAGLVKTDLGTLVLTGANSYAAGTTVNGGTLQIGNGGATGSITGDIANNGTLVVNRSGSIMLDGTISGTGSLAKLGSSVLTLTGTNSYLGGTVVGGGTVQISSDANLGDVAGMLSLQGGTLQAAASFSSGRNVLLGSTTSNSIDTQGFDVTLNGTIGDGPNNSSGDFVTKLGSGTLTLTGANTYANRTVIAGGTLALAGAGTIGAGNLVVGAGTIFDISQTTSGARVIQLNSGAAGTIALGAKTLTLGFGNSSSDWSGTITDGGIAGGTGGSVVIAAPSGAVRFFESNSYTGGTIVSSGTFALAGNGSLNNSAAVAVDAGAVFDIAGLTAAGTTIGDLSGAGTLSLGGKSLTFGTGTSTTYSGTISGTGGALVKTGTGSFTLSGANIYTGATDVTAGTLLVNGDQSAATGLASIASAATLGGIGIIGGSVDMTAGGTLAPGSNGAGTLTINGNLLLGGSAQLAFEFGQAGVAGGALNDLVNVGGNLTLDGTINVTPSAGGSFDVGIYRVFNYSGSLTDNGLSIGAMPAGSGTLVQTSVANQVNLVNAGGLNLNFWDGAAGPKFDGVINGGNGTWQNGTGNDNWTDANGAVNAGYSDGAVAIFAGNSGTVTVDSGLGAVTASGMQFASDGYVITGDAVTLTGAQATLRVGDGSAAGAGYTATVASALTGSSQLVKTDLGTLVLTATNSYAGGTRIDGGTLSIGNGGATGSITGAIANNGALVVNRTGTVTLDGAISGTGTLTKLGSGTLILTGASLYAGGTLIGGGTVQISGDANLGDVAGTLSLQGGTLRAGASLASARAILLGSPTSNAIDTQGFDVTLGGTIGDGPNNSSGDFVTKLGSGTLTLTGANTYSNRTVIAGGTLALAGAGTIGAGNLGVGAGTVFDISQTNSGARVIQLNNGAAGTIALGSRTLTLGFGNSSSDWSGTITDGGIAGGVGGGVAIAAPSGVVRFFEANLYTGGTIVSSGTFALAGNGSLYSGGAVAMETGTVFDIAGLTAAGTTIGDLSGAGTVSLGGKSLTFGTGNSTSFSGIIGGSGGALVKTGSGSFTLSGANTYTGATSVTAGTLLVNGNQSAATGLTSVALGATLGGTGIIGGNVVVADGATLAPGSNGVGTLAINGNVGFSPNATLAFEFGQANVPGGSLNDMVSVGGNLTLDGTINVSVPAGGSFGPGVYRVLSYAGGLTDNGLTIGTMPAGNQAFVQTAVANQVNLANTAGLTLNFWDGTTGTKNDGAIQGGNGSWTLGGGHNDWTGVNGMVNADFAPDSFAIFQGTGGVVSVDNSGGNVSVTGMQFTAGGYTIAGGPLTLTGTDALVRTGDGGAGDAALTTTISATLAGSARLVKDMAGALVLSGANTYAGGTAINGGTIRFATDANLGAAAGGLSLNGGTLNNTASLNSARAVEFAGEGTFLTDAGTTLTLGGAVTGAGSLTKSGAGILVLTGSGSYAGATNVGAGTLLVNGNFGGATGATSVAAGASLGGMGTIGGNVALADGAILSPGAGGAGTLAIGGNLSLAAGTTLAYEFGKADIAGGALNDLVTVGGNLALDGTINVTVPTGGAFDAGVYRVFTYGGTLTDNGLTLGTMPGGSSVSVQTSISGQVNLVNSAGLTLSFWDGGTGAKNNGLINGGSGVWQNSTGNDNWADAKGMVNAPYSTGTFAIFAGTGGAVTVDNNLGQVTASGMQFATSGYTIGGGAIALGGSQSTIRVGDGSASGASFTATINSVLSGNTQLSKTDAGTLVLGGVNSYTGGTQISGGTVQISADANLGATSGGVTLNGGTLATSATLASARNFAITGSGTIATTSGTTMTLSGKLSGTGTLTAAGAGMLVVSGDGSGFAGSTQVQGTLAVNGSLCGDVNVLTGARLQGTGTVCTTHNAGTVAPGNSIGTLTVAGDYTGTGGKLEIEARLGDDASPTDRLVVTGNTSGATQIQVVNVGGNGAATVEGIRIIDVGGVSNAVFALKGDYVFEGSQAVIAGAYGYRLYKGGVSTPSDGDWYLRSSLLDPPTPPGAPTAPSAPNLPLYQPGVPVYEVYGQTLLALTDVGTMQQRIGTRQWAQTESGRPSGIWGRTEARHSRPNAVLSTSLSDVNLDNWKFEIGADHVLSAGSKGTSLVLGVLGSYGEASARIGSLFGNGGIKTKAYSAGTTLSWFGPQGLYVDGRVQVTWFDSKLKSALLGRLADGNHGTGQAYSVEAGKRSPIGGNLSVTPQIQIAYSTVGFDHFTDPHGAQVSSKRGDSLKTRWGLSLDRQDAKSRVYGVANLTYEWLDGTVTDVSGTPISRQNHRLWGEFGAGGSVLFGNRLTFYTEASANTAINDFGKSYTLKGVAGLRLAF
jgi:fibronectin-binding autotransporter adhesin